MSTLPIEHLPDRWRRQVGLELADVAERLCGAPPLSPAHERGGAARGDADARDQNRAKHRPSSQTSDARQVFGGEK